jgi:membrane peptidoglycan carboxypeptidase
MDRQFFFSKKPVERKKGRTKRIITGILAVFFLLAGIFALAGTVFFATTLKDLPDPDHLITRKVNQSTQIYDRTGTHLLYEFHADQNRTVVPLSDVSKYAQEATIAIEDKYFYQHKGYRITSMIRAAIMDVLTGSNSQGGSTITQQLVKNAILTNEKSYTRKIKELILASEIEHRFSKDDILKMYFNEIPYGSTSYGIQAAAQSFFGKDAKDLDLAESALLAAIPQSTTYYSPYGTHTDALITRWKLVLDLMAQQGYITKDQAEATKKIDILGRIVPKHESISAPHFVFYIRDELAAAYGDDAVENGGLKVITTLDWNLQQAAEKAIADNIAGVEKNGGSNAALVSIDPKTGQILAMVGSRDYFDVIDSGAVNMAITPRQPGSSFKPLVYLTAFEKGYTPNTVLYDVDTDFPTPQGIYSPQDFTKKELGPVTMRTALQGSLNTPAVKTLYLAGIDNVLDNADAFGYTTLKDRSRFGLSLVLGAGEVSLLEHTAVYSIYADEGIKYPTASILKVTDAKGNVLQEWQPSAGVRVADAEMVRNLTDVLQDNASRAFMFGLKNNLTLPDRQVAAKTGTTNDARDGWTMGYTPSMVAGVWIGNNDNRPMATSASASAIWNQYMRTATADQPIETFTPPLPITTGKPVLDGGVTGATKVTIDKISGKLATDFTPAIDREDKTYNELHDILYYVNKDDPRGPAPTDPSADPMFAPWEAAVQRWAAKNGIVAQHAPTEYDDIHLPQDVPTVNFINPTDGSTLSSRTISLAVNTSATRGVKRVDYAIDGIALGSGTSGPDFALNTIIPDSIVRGFHTITATAYDDIDDNATATININFNY